MQSSTSPKGTGILEPSPTKTRIFNFMGILFLSLYLILKYILQTPFSTQSWFPFILIVAGVFQLFGVYYWSLGISQHKMFFVGFAGLFLSIVLLVLYLSYKFPLTLEIGIILMLLSIFLLFFGLLLFFRKKEVLR